jgi:hypothetical protein
MNPKLEMRLRNAVVGLLAFVLALAIWLPCLHLFYSKPTTDFYLPQGISPKARQLAARHLRLWTEPTMRQAELKKMRGSNAEWDFMGRSFLVWSLVNMGLREPQMKAQYLPVIDQTWRLSCWCPFC